jgi:hypothetical protein
MLNNFTLSLTRNSSLFRWILLLIVVHTVIAQYIAISIFSPQRSTTRTAVALNVPINFNATAFQNVVFLEALQVRLTASHAVNLTVRATFEPLSILNGTNSLIEYSSFPLQINHYLLDDLS